MILGLLLGCGVSVGFLFVWNRIQYGVSIHQWLQSISKFVYTAGHPLLDDDQKYQQLLRNYRVLARAILGLTLKTAGMVLIAVVLVIMATLFEGKLDGQSARASFDLFRTEREIPSFLLGVPFWIGNFGPIVFFCLQRKPARREDYSSIDRFLHYLFLGCSPITRMLLDLEIWIHKKKIRSSRSVQNVYISGLPRSGSTSLMQYLGQISNFRSLSYLNLPFLLMPVTGLRQVSKSQKNEKERAHEDGMKHSLESYEALEEPFWLHFAGADYVKEDRLCRHAIPDSIYEKYSAFRTLVSESGVYLSKNNNHLLRADSLHEHDFKNGTQTRTIIPFRNPYDQARSLLRQHKRLSDLQSSDEFTLDYTDMLVHHEFGLHAKVPMLNSESSELIRGGDRDSIEYWLELWCQFYHAAWTRYGSVDGFCFFCYDRYLENPRESLNRLLCFLEISESQSQTITVKKWETKSHDRVESLPQKCVDLYQLLIKGAINRET